jgi:hypothetical protein
MNDHRKKGEEDYILYNAEKREVIPLDVNHVEVKPIVRAIMD